MITHIGFTGTRDGLTTAQAHKLDYFLQNFGGTYVARHGGCIGADKEFHDLALGDEKCYHIIVHPSKDPSLQANYYVRPNRDHVRPPLDYLIRNKNIVYTSNLMVACPKEDKPVIRSGTWATIRLCRDEGTRLYTIYPNGAMIYEQNTPQIHT